MQLEIRAWFGSAHEYPDRCLFKCLSAVKLELFLRLLCVKRPRAEVGSRDESHPRTIAEASGVKSARILRTKATNA